MIRTLRLNSLLFTAALLGLLAGCSQGLSLSSIVLDPSTASVPKGHTRALAASGKFSDGTTQPIADATWTTSAAATATVSSSGLVTGIAVGTATITATSSGRTATAAITVTPSLLASIAATPATVALDVGATQPLAVTGTYEDTTTAPLTSGVSFAVTAATPAGAATVDASTGLITAVAAGTATVTAIGGGKTATVSVTINAPSLVSISAAPTSVTLEIGKTQAVTVTGTFSSGPAAVLTYGVTFAVTAATPSGAATVDSSSGVITAVAAGTATITATASGKTATVSVTVNPRILVSIGATPSPVNLPAGFTQALTVKGTYSNSDIATLTSGVSFAVTASTPSGAATVGATSGIITGVAAGTATVTVTSGGKTTTVAVTVTAATLTSIAIDNPSPVALNVGQQATLTVTGTFSDTSTHPLSTGVTFAVTAATPSGAATVGASSGVVSAVAAGTATVTATHTASGKTATVTVNVTAVTLTTITMAPNQVTLPKTSGTATFVVTGHYSDSTTAVIPNASVSFVSNASSVVSVSTGGVITAGLAGTTTITVTVSPAPPVNVPVQIYDPASARVFYDDYDPGVFFLAFGGSTNDVSRDPATLNNGRASLKVVVGTVGSYTGGALVAPPHDLRTYNALSFWAKATTSVTMNSIGFGDTAAAGSGPLIVETHATPLTTTFTKYYIPIPNPANATGAVGLFYFADGLKGYTAWFNDIQYESLDATTFASTFGAVNNVSAAWPAPTVAKGDTFQLDFNPNTVFYQKAATPTITLYRVGWNYFTLASDNTAVATVDTNGVITGQGAGTAHISAMLGSTSVPGQAVVTGVLPLAVPGSTDIAPTPVVAAGNVISLFSSAYTPYTTASSGRPWEAAITWQASWSSGGNEILDPYLIGSHSVIKYTLHAFVGIEFYPGATGGSVPSIDATSMTTLHVDVWTPNPPAKLQVQLVQDPATPAAKIVGLYNATGITTASWNSLEIPLSSFSPALSSKNKLGQMLFVSHTVTDGDTNAVIYVDNIYLHN